MPSEKKVLALTFAFSSAERERIKEALVAVYGENVGIVTSDELDGVRTTITQAPLIGVVVLGERLEFAPLGSGRTYPQEIRYYFQTAQKRAPQIMVRDRVSCALRSCQE
ncbi:MAG: hypothetical protein Q8N84_02525 [bacterium]|nr:hypothetical protein [bacterium]